MNKMKNLGGIGKKIKEIIYRLDFHYLVRTKFIYTNHLISMRLLKFVGNQFYQKSKLLKNGPT